MGDSARAAASLPAVLRFAGVLTADRALAETTLNGRSALELSFKESGDGNSSVSQWQRGDTGPADAPGQAVAAVTGHG